MKATTRYGTYRKDSKTHVVELDEHGATKSRAVCGRNTTNEVAGNFNYVNCIKCKNILRIRDYEFDPY